MKKSSAHFGYTQCKQKGIIHIPILLIILAVAGLLIWFFLNEGKLLFFENKGQLGTKRGITVPITPSQLAPSVSLPQARATICNMKKEGLFARACQEKFNVVGKDDGEKLAELFTFVKKIQDDKSLSDYDKLLLGQVVFASLPTKDSPQALLDHSLLAHLRDFLKSKNVVYAQDLIMSEKEFKSLMTDDLGRVLDLPKGNNSWVINIMVSKYQWVDGVRQPIYSDQYKESVDPYPGNPVELKDKSKITYNVSSVVGSRATSQQILEGPFKGTGEMIAYSFSIMSWYSPPYGSDSVLIKAEAGPDAKYLTSRQDRSEENYSGENLLSDLLSKVKMPSREQAKKSESKTTTKSEVKESQPEVKPGDKITCEQVWKIVGSDECEKFVVSNDEGGVWCNLPDTRESLQPWIYGPAATYTFTPWTCAVE